MMNIPSIRVFNIAFVFIIYSVLFSSLPVNAQEGNNDYFTAHPPPQGEYLLGTVERYHLSSTYGFWPQFNAGQYVNAVGELKYILRYFPNHPKALKLLCFLAKLTKDYELPISYFEKALRLFPQYAYTHAQFGNYLVETDEYFAEIDKDNVYYKEGIAGLKKAIEMDPKMVKAYAWLAKAYHKKGNSELALQAGRKAKELGYKGKILDEILGNDTK